MRSLIFFLWASILFFSCNLSEKDSSKTLTGGNKFSDKTLQVIARAQYNRDSESLLSFLSDNNAIYRKAAAMAFASVQDTAAVVELAKLLNDKELQVRIAAAFAIGQSGTNEGTKLLYAHFLSESNDLAKKAYLEAIGKCGNVKMMEELIKLNPDYSHQDVWEGKALSLARFSIRGITNEKLLSDVFTMLSSKQLSPSVKYYASIALNRNRLGISNEQLEVIKNLYNKSEIVDIKLNLVLGAGKNTSDSSLIFLRSVFETAQDYRLRINALRSLSGFDYKLVKDIYFAALNDKNINVAIRSSEYFTVSGVSADAKLYAETAKTIDNWRVCANMLFAADKFANKDFKTEISNYIIEKYNNSDNVYEKAWLLRALSGNIEKWHFIKNEVFSTDVPVIRSVGMDALSEIYNKIDHTDIELQKEFIKIFKSAVLSKDVALISVAAGILRNPDFNFKEIINDYGFLKTAAKNCRLPKELEAYLELQKTLVFFQDSEKVEMPDIKYKKPDWEAIKMISPTQKVIVKTSKGEFVIRLFVDDCPVTVAAFIELIKNDFYKGLHIHRVVPNFVIQDGCPRGDGWGSPDFSIRSEFADTYYTTGSLGMASAGKDTESSQWFVTHSPTPHLDGRYTLFGKVIEGMDVVHKIEVGDEIYNIELIK